MGAARTVTAMTPIGRGKQQLDAELMRFNHDRRAALESGFGTGDTSPALALPAPASAEGAKLAALLRSTQETEGVRWASSNSGNTAAVFQRFDPVPVLPSAKPPPYKPPPTRPHTSMACPPGASQLAATSAAGTVQPQQPQQPPWPQQPQQSQPRGPEQGGTEPPDGWPFTDYL